MLWVHKVPYIRTDGVREIILHVVMVLRGNERCTWLYCCSNYQAHLLIIRIEERRFRYQSYVIYKNSFLIFFNIIRLNLCKTHGVSQWWPLHVMCRMNRTCYMVIFWRQSSFHDEMMIRKNVLMWFKVRSRNVYYILTSIKLLSLIPSKA